MIFLYCNNIILFLFMLHNNSVSAKNTLFLSKKQIFHRCDLVNSFSTIIRIRWEKKEIYYMFIYYYTVRHMHV